MDLDHNLFFLKKQLISTYCLYSLGLRAMAPLMVFLETVMRDSTQLLQLKRPGYMPVQLETQVAFLSL